MTLPSGRTRPTGDSLRRDRVGTLTPIGLDVGPLVPLEHNSTRPDGRESCRAASGPPAPTRDRSRVVKFAVIGALNTGVAYGCFAGLYLLLSRWPYMAVLVVSRELSVLFAYALYRRFVFPVRGPIVAEFGRFWLVYAGSLVLNMLALPVLVEVVHLPVLLAQAIVTALAIAASWIGHTRFSFRSRPSKADIAGP